MAKNKDYKINWTDFCPCVADEIWFVSRHGVYDQETKKGVVFIFGCGALDAALHNKEEKKTNLVDLAHDVVTEYISFGFPEKTCYWFEFDGESFRVCKERPKWADYDCGATEL